MLGGLGGTEILIILVIALIFIGPQKLPELAKGLGKGIRDFKKAAQGLTDEVEEEVKQVKDEVKEVKESVVNNSDTSSVDKNNASS